MRFFLLTLLISYLISPYKLKIWREYRGLTTQELADAVGILQAYLSKIENGNKEGSLKVWKSLSLKLNADLELLV